MNATPFSLTPFHTDAVPAMQNMSADDAVRYAELGFSVPAHLLVQALDVTRDESYDEGHRAGYEECERDNEGQRAADRQKDLEEMRADHARTLDAAFEVGAADERQRLATRTAAAFDTLRSLLNSHRDAAGLKALRMIEDALNP